MSVVFTGIAAIAQPLPKTAGPPVILLNGYQLICSSTPVPSSDTFGRLETLLRESGREVRFFDNCRQGRVSIAELSRALRTYLNELIYEDGTPVPQVDLIGHSMGGLIARCYLAGCSDEPGVFQPPFPKRVRKVITIGTPHFGAEFGGVAPDLQAALMIPGSAFLYNLATWNQFRDDWRGVDALAIVGRSVGTRPGDGLVSALSASGYFAYGVPEDRTRVISGCHTGGFAAIFLGCSAVERTIAGVSGADHPTWLLIKAHLAGELKPETFSAGEDSELSAQAGFWLTYRGAGDELPTSLVAKLGEAGLAQLPDSPVAFLARTPQVTDAPLELAVNGQPGVAVTTVTLGRGVQTLALKPGVVMGRVEMDSTAEGVYAGTGKVLVPGGTIRISGSAELAAVTEVLLEDQPIESWSLSQDESGAAPGTLRAVIPARRPGAAMLKVRTGTEAGEHSIRVVFGPEPARLDPASGGWQWNAVEGAEGYALWVGSEPGKSDLFELPFTQDLSTPNVPQPTQKLYIRLWTRHDGDWYYRDSILE